MLATIRDDTWNVLNIQHTTPNSKDGIIHTHPPPDQVRPRYHNRSIPLTPQCISQISHNVSFCDRNVDTCAHFCYKMVHCGIWDWCIFYLCKRSFVEERCDVRHVQIQSGGMDWENCPHYWPIVKGIHGHRFLAKGRVRRALMLL